VGRGDLTEVEWRILPCYFWLNGSLESATAGAGREQSQRHQRHLIAALNRTRWRDVPEKYGKWSSIYRRFRRWSACRVGERSDLVAGSVRLIRSQPLAQGESAGHRLQKHTVVH
jgi:hypothetical protein